MVRYARKLAVVRTSLCQGTALRNAPFSQVFPCSTHPTLNNPGQPLIKTENSSTASCRIDSSDVDLFHLHHRLERALGDSRVGIGYRLRQGNRRDLPG